jgi:hypothetical protein
MELQLERMVVVLVRIDQLVESRSSLEAGLLGTQRRRAGTDRRASSCRVIHAAVRHRTRTGWLVDQIGHFPVRLEGPRTARVPWFAPARWILRRHVGRVVAGKRTRLVGRAAFAFRHSANAAGALPPLDPSAAQIPSRRLRLWLGVSTPLARCDCADTARSGLGSGRVR